VKLAVISDIHGNRLALEAVLDDIRRQGADVVVNLGDIVAGPLDPAGAVARLMALDLPTVRGNHDRVLSTPESDEFGAIDRFALDALDDSQRGWLARLPATLVLDDVFLCHGTPLSDTDPWIDGWWRGRSMTIPGEAEVTALAAGIGQSLILCGHTHIPRASRLRDGRLIVNPGSVGLQFNHGSPDARYAMVEKRGDAWWAALHCVPYAHEDAARQAEANGFAHWRDALVSGWAPPHGLF
jgi:putative phosphoesterase